MTARTTETKTVFDRWRSGTKVPLRTRLAGTRGFSPRAHFEPGHRPARGDYLVFLDGDTMPHPRFVADHRALAARHGLCKAIARWSSEKAAAWFGKNNFSADRRRAAFPKSDFRPEKFFPLAVRRYRKINASSARNSRLQSGHLACRPRPRERLQRGVCRLGPRGFRTGRPFDEFRRAPAGCARPGAVLPSLASARQPRRTRRQR